jgi:hypothetical protein
VVKYQASRQFAFYAILWNQKHPEKPCYDSVLNMVPSHVTQVLGILGDRAGNVAQPEVKRIHLQSFSETYLEELKDSTIVLCNQIMWVLDGSLDPLTTFAENESACIGFKGSRCAYYDLCTDPEMRETLIGEVFKQKEA